MRLQVLDKPYCTFYVQRQKRRGVLIKTFTRTEHEELRRLVAVLLVTSVPALAISIYISVISGSLSVVAIILDSAVAQAINLMNYFVLGVVIRGNTFKYPYGTGKLEDFAGFAYGWSILFVCGVVIHQAIYRLVGPPLQISLGLALVAVIISLVRIAVIVAWLSRIIRRHGGRSPLLHVYYINCRGVMWYTGGILGAMMIGWFLADQWGNAIALMIDLMIAVAYSLYLLVTGAGVIKANFRALLDLPLPEPDQMAVLNVLTRHYDDYAILVNVLTRSSGGRKRVEIELAFLPETDVQRIEVIRSRMKEELQRHFGKIDFTLIARCLDSPNPELSAGQSGGGE